MTGLQYIQSNYKVPSPTKVVGLSRIRSLARVLRLDLLNSTNCSLFSQNVINNDPSREVLARHRSEGFKAVR